MSNNTPTMMSVVIATHNRLPSLIRLLRQLGRQTMSADRFEVVVVDDGSKEPVEFAVHSLRTAYRLTVVTQENAGAAAARHRGVERASGDILVIIDDDMQVPPHFLAEHLRRHPRGSRTAVLGRMLADASIDTMPLFERFHAAMLDRFAADVEAGRRQVDGTRLYTGNVSMRRADYLAVGGFDPSLGHSEDVELGIRLQKSGVRFVASETASTIHSSDHASQAAWMNRALLYGIFDSRIARKHPEPFVSPWRQLWDAHPLSRPFLAASVLAPRVAGGVAHLGMAVSMRLDKAGYERTAIAGATVVYAMQYFRGVRREAGSLRTVLRQMTSYARQRRRAAGHLQLERAAV
jgi:GT2 family glycosyltransferase